MGSVCVNDLNLLKLPTGKTLSELKQIEGKEL